VAGLVRHDHPVGVIINPTISAKAITGSETYAAQVRGGPRQLLQHLAATQAGTTPAVGVVAE
jgi:hypothetical protein